MSDRSEFPTPSKPLMTGSGVNTRRLGEADAAILDTLLEARAHGSAPTHLPARSSERAARVMALLDLLDADPVEPAPADLTARTLDRVRQFRQQQRFAAQVQMLTEERPSLGVGWGQFLSVGAVFLLAAALVFPVLERNQADARQIACAANLHGAGQAIQQYAVANAGMLPRLPVNVGSRWWDVGRSNGADEGEPVTSNSAHLYLLVRDNPGAAKTLVCPENGHARPDELKRSFRDWPEPRAVSFSYQNQYTAKPIRVADNPHLALLADKNPLFVAPRSGGGVTFARGTPVDAPSRSHGSRGQNVLTADGSVQWTVRPHVSRLGAPEGDNIWTLPGVKVYRGNEAPVVGRGGRVDTFLVP